MTGAARTSQGDAKLHLGEWLARLGLRQAEVARAAGVGRSYMSLMVSGKKDNPAALKLLRISRVLGVSVNELYQAPPTRREVQKLLSFRQQTLEALRRSEAETE